MSPQISKLGARDIAHVIHPFTDPAAHHVEGPITIVRGEGIRVYDENGKEYIEGVAGLWCAALGFSEAALVEAAVEQMKRLPFYHAFAHRATTPMIDLAERLAALAPGAMPKVFFANSGSEANDTAVKLVWYYNNALGRQRKKKIISRHRSYHGVTIATGSLTGAPHIHQHFDLPLSGFLHTSCPDFFAHARPRESEEDFSTRMADELDRLILAEDPSTVAAFFVDPVMCAAGVLMPPAGYFDKIQAVLSRHDVLLVTDEVITGFGRTGAMFASDLYGLKPDILTCAKALTSAYFPMSAVLVTSRMWEVLAEASHDVGGFWHGFTSGGHPVGAAVALRTLDLIEGGVLDHVRRIAPVFQEHLRSFADHPIVADARGVGLLGAVQLSRGDEPPGKDTATAELCVRRAREHGLVVIARGGAVCFCPPLVITEAEMDEMFRRFERALKDTWQRVGEQQA